MAAVEQGANSNLTVDLPAQSILVHATSQRIDFVFDPVHKDMLVRGLSAVDATLEHRASITRFELDYYNAHPWLA